MGQSMGPSPARMEDLYFIQKVKLGEGSFGTVWRAVDKRDKRIVAIKQLEKALMPRRGVKRQDIEREIRVMMACRHTNIIGLLSTFENEHSVYLALEYCDGGDFGDKLKERGAELEEHEAVKWLRDICSAITALHSASICHRDVKPDNFMLAGMTLKLSDFGARQVLSQWMALSRLYRRTGSVQQARAHVAGLATLRRIEEFNALRTTLARGTEALCMALVVGAPRGMPVDEMLQGNKILAIASVVVLVPMGPRHFRDGLLKVSNIGVSPAELDSDSAAYLLMRSALRRLAAKLRHPVEMESFEEGGGIAGA